MMLILMGVSGSGKTTVGRLLASQLNRPFLDADDFHSPENIRKMSQGVPLTDADRHPWLMAMNQRLRELEKKGTSAVLACSALKETYRQILISEIKDACFIHLHADFETIHKWLRERSGHFMPSSLLQSQFETLEEPAHALKINASQPPEAIVATICRHFALQ
ncbi:MAG: gluconokinase [Verrucomicrobiae bacterium]|nr:gluconokinase [Verrucomicrobiae bacterium]